MRWLSSEFKPTVMRKPLLLLKGVSLGALALVASACSLKLPDPSGQVKVQVSLPEEFRRATESPFRFFSDPVAVPPTSSDFACYAFNIMGPGIPRSGGGNNERPEGEVLQQYYSKKNFCSYAGITTPPLKGSGQVSASLVVPAGQGRIVQMVGIQDPQNVVCSQPDSPVGSQNNTGPNGQDRYFLLGDIITDLFRDRSVSIANGYDGVASAEGKLNRRLDCGDGLHIELVPQARTTAAYTTQNFNVNLKNRDGSAAVATQTLTILVFLEGFGPINGGTSHSLNNSGCVSGVNTGSIGVNSSSTTLCIKYSGATAANFTFKATAIDPSNKEVGFGQGVFGP